MKLIKDPVGRGVLIDYWSYAKQSYDPNTTHSITLEQLLACAKHQNVEFQYGDILIVRSGWLDNYLKLDNPAREALTVAKPAFVGVEQTKEMLDFLHDNYFSAVAGDTPAFEAWPTSQEWRCHEYLLSLWGVPIGEMWDLEKLAETCRERGTYTFYFSSMPANVPGETFLIPSYSKLIPFRWGWELPECYGSILGCILVFLAQRATSR